MNKVLLCALVVGLTVGAFGSFADAGCRYEADRSVAAAASGVEEVVIDAGAGFLVVRGKDGIAEISAQGMACTSDKGDLDEIQLRIRESGSRVRIETVFPRHFFGNSDGRLDFEVVVPSGVRVKIADGSGEMTVEGVADLKISDGSGEMKVSNIDGDLTIDDGSGEIWVSGVAGNVSIDDGSGTIECLDVRGSVDISDGSGEISVEKVDKNVEISDGSGEIDVREVIGDFRVISDGSGSIYAKKIGGDFIVESDGSGGVDSDEIGGRVILD